jgi:hypothetical protein
MNYGQYDSRRPCETRLRDYLNETARKGEMEYFYRWVIGADLFGIMPNEIKNELTKYAKQTELGLRQQELCIPMQTVRLSMQADRW